MGRHFKVFRLIRQILLTNRNQSLSTNPRTKIRGFFTALIQSVFIALYLVFEEDNKKPGSCLPGLTLSFEPMIYLINGYVLCRYSEAATQSTSIFHYIREYLKVNHLLIMDVSLLTRNTLTESPEKCQLVFQKTCFPPATKV